MIKELHSDKVSIDISPDIATGHSIADAVVDAITQSLPGCGALSLDLLKNSSALQTASRVVNAMPIAVCIVAQNLRYVLANTMYEKVAKVVGVAKPTWRGLTIPEYLPEFVHSCSLPHVERALRGEGSAFYITIRPKNGDVQTLFINYKPFFAEMGSPKNFSLMTGQDVTALKHAAEQTAATERLEAIGRLAANFAHEYNNQLHVILGNLALLDFQLSAPQHKKLISKCQLAAEQCTALTSKMMAFGRRQVLQPREIDVSQQLVSFSEVIRKSLPDTIVLELRLDAKQAMLRIDPVQFERMITSLVSNARDAVSERGQIQITTQFAEQVEQEFLPCDRSTAEFVMIEVSDNGSGMTDAIANRMFDPFFTTKTQNGNTGMGLAMVYGFVKQSGGEVNVLTASSAGTKVRVFLPSAEVSEPETEGPLLASSESKGRRRILVVEDQDTVASTLLDMLQHMGHHIETCNTAAAAMEILRTQPIDVIITDVMIKGPLTGLALSDLVNTQYPTVRIICVSGYTDPCTLPSGTLDPRVEFLKKPVRFSDLQAALAHPVRP